MHLLHLNSTIRRPADPFFESTHLPSNATGSAMLGSDLTDEPSSSISRKLVAAGNVVPHLSFANESANRLLLSFITD